MFDRYKFKFNDTFINIESIKNLAKDTEKCKSHEIILEEEFRPDLIAYNLYNDVSMADFLAILNDIEDTPEGFYRGRIIRVLREEYKELVYAG